MDAAIWAKLHGAATHFPFALTLCSGACDATGFVLADRSVVSGLHAAGYWTILFAAAGSIPAVFSGLLMTHGRLLGHGALRMHHVFVWPAFALIVTLATWRMCVGRRVTRGMLTAYLFVIGVTAGCLCAASYWGGEMMLAS